MDEGVAGYMSYVALRESLYRDDIQAWHELQFETARKAQAEGKWISIDELSSENGWNIAEALRPGLAFAEAYVVVNYLVANYGFDNCIAIYKNVRYSDYNAEKAMSSTIHLMFRELESALREWLAETDSVIPGSGE